MIAPLANIKVDTINWVKMFSTLWNFALKNLTHFFVLKSDCV